MSCKPSQARRATRRAGRIGAVGGWAAAGTSQPRRTTHNSVDHPQTVGLSRQGGPIKYELTNNFERTPQVSISPDSVIWPCQSWCLARPGLNPSRGRSSTKTLQYYPGSNHSYANSTKQLQLHQPHLLHPLPPSPVQPIHSRPPPPPPRLTRTPTRPLTHAARPPSPTTPSQYSTAVHSRTPPHPLPRRMVSAGVPARPVG